MMRMKIGDTFYLVLEPANFSRLREQKPLVLGTGEFSGMENLVICFCPDIPRLSINIGNLKEPITPKKLGEMLLESQEWRDLDRTAN